MSVVTGMLALEFKVKVGYENGVAKYPGFFKITLVMATDEHPHHLNENNYYDSVAVIVKHNTNSHIPKQNIFTFREVVQTNPLVVDAKPLSMKVLFA